MKKRSVLYLLVGLSSATSLTFGQFVFSGSGTGAIPDGGAAGPGDWGAPLDVTFNVSGLPAAIASMSVSLTIRHPISGDLEATLIPPQPSGLSSFLLFSRVAEPFGFNGGGSPAHFSADADGNVAGTYVFSDSATGNLWAAAGFDTSTETADFPFNIPPGSYRTSAAGPWDPVNNPNAGQLTSFSGTGFIGLSPEQAAGTWTLRIRDGFLEDTGVVSAADLTFTVVPEPAEYAAVAALALIAFATCRRMQQRRSAADGPAV